MIEIDLFAFIRPQPRKIAIEVIERNGHRLIGKFLAQAMRQPTFARTTTAGDRD